MFEYMISLRESHLFKVLVLVSIHRLSRALFLLYAYIFNLSGTTALLGPLADSSE